VRRQHLGFRSPLSYFHNGLAARLDDVVALYQKSLGFVFTPDEAADLVAFLQAL
jgi:cytochrome c peroxidase